MVAHLSGGQKVAGSNPVTPTKIGLIMANEDSIIEEFLSLHIPEGCVEYVPSGTEEHFSKELYEHFQQLEFEQNVELNNISNQRFIG